MVRRGVVLASERFMVFRTQMRSRGQLDLDEAASDLAVDGLAEVRGQKSADRSRKSEAGGLRHWMVKTLKR